MDTNPLRQAYDALLAAQPRAVPPPGEWNSAQILAHVVLVGAATISAVAAIASGPVPTYDNRLSQDPWTLERVIALAGGEAGLRDRIRAQATALCALAAVLGEAELATEVPTLLLSNGTCLVDQPLPLGDILAGLASEELPGHAKQL
ncbi:DinB family protein [Micromonospora avicenniae]|uniref:DinB superfamily protein n=1 Tax=Micromonospora avicenniae TaxID=1198245 RepID=A0A1N7B8M8_9ACTN|nr:DinB family protein [Micromonospora avicenniae]SIR47715.1 DinB superfamily protein [Micromonospora avicenniae]